MHVSTGTTEKARQPRVWLDAARQCTTWANRTARRSDLSVIIGPDAAKVAGTAMFTPSQADIELCTTTLMPGGKPEDFNLSSKLWKLRNAPIVGALAHEAAHAAFSKLVPADLYAWRGVDGERMTRSEIDLINTLEESFIEYKLLKRSPSLKPFLRRMAMEIVNKDFRVADTRYGASMGAALTVARVDAGSVSRPAGKRFAAILSEQLDKPTLAALRVLWREYQALEITSKWYYPYATVKRIAADWIALVVDPEEDEQDDLASPKLIMISESGEGEGSEGESSEGEGDSDSDGSDGSDGNGKSKLGEALEEAAREESVEADTDLGDEVRKEVMREHVAEKNADAARRAEGKPEAKRVFGRVHAHGESRGGRGITRRAPKSDERAAATRLARLLSSITTHDKVATRTSSMLPPGRVHGRSAVLGSAQIAQRQQITAEPFVSVRRKHVDTDKIAIAVLTDVSGSMGAATAPLGVMNWMISTAANQIDARYCSVLFGERAEGMVRPGAKVSEVVIAEACDGSEQIEPAMKAVDYELRLLDGTGTRVLIILSDGYLVDSSQAEYCATFLRLCKQRGVTVIWGNWNDLHTNHGYGTPVNLYGKTPAECAETLGREIAEAVKRTQRAAA